MIRPHTRDNPEMDESKQLFPFRFFDPIRGRWVAARYKASREVIAQRYEQWEITGPGEVPAGGQGQFKPPGG
jgi:hypothetical protein